MQRDTQFLCLIGFSLVLIGAVVPASNLLKYEQIVYAERNVAIFPRTHYSTLLLRIYRGIVPNDTMPIVIPAIPLFDRNVVDSRT